MVNECGPVIERIGRMRELRAYFEQGGLKVQYNVVSADDMRAAQKDPAAYRNQPAFSPRLPNSPTDSRARDPRRTTAHV
jgi:hypothetical protein